MTQMKQKGLMTVDNPGCRVGQSGRFFNHCNIYFAKISEFMNSSSAFVSIGGALCGCNVQGSGYD